MFTQLVSWGNEMIRILTLLTLSTLTLASEKTEKCILDTPDGLKKSLVENFSELAEKGYKPCSENCAYSSGVKNQKILF